MCVRARPLLASYTVSSISNIIPIAGLQEPTPFSYVYIHERSPSSYHLALDSFPTDPRRELMKSSPGCAARQWRDPWTWTMRRSLLRYLQRWMLVMRQLFRSRLSRNRKLQTVGSKFVICLLCMCQRIPQASGALGESIQIGQFCSSRISS